MPLTMQDTAKAYRIFKAKRPDIKLMFVPQGVDLMEWMMCLDCLWPMEPDAIGVPKLLTHRSGPNARVKAVEYIRKRYDSSIPIHLLGVWYDIKELDMFDPNLYVRGCDSTIPYLYAREGRTLGEGPKPLDIMDPYDENVDKELLKSNLEIWRSCGLR
jgi:hypothetical protein